MSDETLFGSHAVSGIQGLEAIAVLLAEQLRPGDIICLQGDLGAGKTTFAQYVGKALGVEEEITSPTYTMLAEYEIRKKTNEITKFIHIDAYRESMDTNYVHEVMRTAAEQKAIAVIEWPEKLGVEIINPHWNISIASGRTIGERIITVVR